MKKRLKRKKIKKTNAGKFKTSNRHKVHRKKSTKKTTKKTKLGRVKSFISNFDRLIEGGFEHNSTNLLVGGAGSGKSIFGTQFLIGGMKNGEKCLYVTFEEKKSRFYKNMLKLGWDLEDYEKKGLFTFLEYTPIKVKTMLEEGGGTIESIIVKNKITRIIIDSITSFALLFENELEKREAALALFNMISAWDCTSLLTFEGQPMKDEKLASRTLEFESDSIILFHFIRDKFGRSRFIEILKMRGTKHSKRVYKFKIDKGGFKISLRPVSLKFNK